MKTWEVTLTYIVEASTAGIAIAVAKLNLHSAEPIEEIAEEVSDEVFD